MRLEHHLVGGYVQILSPNIIIMIHYPVFKSIRARIDVGTRIFFPISGSIHGILLCVI